MKKLIIAIDGPAASGKSSVAKLLARRLNYLYIDTGAMYRAITLIALRSHVDLKDQQAISKLLEDCDIQVGKEFIFLNGEDVTSAIRSNAVTEHVSLISSYPKVREVMMSKQREIGKDGGVVMDGRDIGTYVFPTADIKIYQTADAETRALRRYQENRVHGREMSLEEVHQDIVRRDKYDSTREFAPLKKANDAVLMDTTSMSVEDVVSKILDLVKNKTGEEFK
jgi:cytidylate kinase